MLQCLLQPWGKEYDVPMRWSDMDRRSQIISNEMQWCVMKCNETRKCAMKCNETRKCAMKRKNAREHALSASVGIHRAYGALYRNVLHGIPMEVQVIMRTINRLLAWICPLRAHRNMSPYNVHHLLPCLEKQGTLGSPHLPAWIWVLCPGIQPWRPHLHSLIHQWTRCH